MRINLRYALPTTATVVGKIGGHVGITLTVIGDSPLGLPMAAIFSQELCELRSQGKYIAEVGPLASHPDSRRRQRALALYADKAIVLYSMRNLGADDLVIAVNPKHEWVYKHLLLFETVSKEVRRYHCVNDAPAVAMRLDLQQCQERWRRVYDGRPQARSFYQFFVSKDDGHFDLPMGDEPHNVWDDELFLYFFEHKTDPRRYGHGSLLDLYRIMYRYPQVADAAGSRQPVPLSGEGVPSPGAER